MSALFEPGGHVHRPIEPLPDALALQPSRCTCMAPVTDAQLKLMTLYGALQELEWLTVEAQHAVSGPAPLGCPPLHEFLLMLQLELTRAQGICLNHAFPSSGSDR